MNQNNGPRCKDTHAAQDKAGDDRAVQWAPKHSKPDKRTKDQGLSDKTKKTLSR